MRYKLFCIITLILLVAGISAFTNQLHIDEDKFISYTVDPAKQNIQLYWKDDSGQILKSIQNLKTFVDSKHATLIFAMNAGMYQADNKPLGLFIQYGKTLSSLNTRSGGGNFYLKPNGIFYITTDNKAAVCQTEVFSHTENIKFATQSGPMLVIDGNIHTAFVEGSANVKIRNGVGILPDGKILFAMSKTEVNFYEFAAYFQKQGCRNALYLDGFVSRMYFPEKHWMQTDGNFGVMIGISKKK